MYIREVVTANDKKEFLQAGINIYKNDPNWIRPLDSDIEEVFDPKKNKFLLRGGACTRMLLYSDDNRLIGRVAAFVNKQYTQTQPTGGVGFFECIDSQEAANFLFDACKQWLTERGMEAMDGPINLGERDKWWGLLVDGFYSALYGMNYNPPYYKQLFENYGFMSYFNQICYGMKVQSRLSEKFYHRHAVLAQDPQYKAVHIEKKNLAKYVKDFTLVYNKSFAAHGESKSLEERHVSKLFESFKPVMDEKIIWFAYYGSQPIAMWVNIPDINQFIKYFNGRMGVLEKLRFLWLKKFGHSSRFVGIVVGVVPEFQKIGVDAYIIVEAAKLIQRETKYEDYEMQWIGEFNPKMINIATSLEAKQTRLLTTYRYLFDRTMEFKRHPILK